MISSLRPANTRLLLTAILVVAAALRLYGIGAESFWLDEAMTMQRIGNSYVGLLHDWDSHRQGPLFMFLQKAWCDVFGDSPAAARLPAAVFGVACVAATYALGRRFFTSTAALLAAFLLAINPFAIFYSQEARPYSLFLLATLLSTLFAARLLQEFRRRDAVAYAVTTLAALYAHPYGAFLLVSHLVQYAAARWTRGFPAARSRSWSLAGVFALVLLLYLPQMLVFARTFLQKASDPYAAGAWIPRPSLDYLGDIFRQYFMWGRITMVVMVLIGLGLVLELRRDSAARPGLLMLTAPVIAFLIVPGLVSFAVTPILGPRFTIPVVPALLLTLGWTLSRTDFRIRSAILLLIAALTVVPLYHYYTETDKEPLGLASELIRSQYRPGDIIVPSVSWMGRAMEFYARKWPDARVVQVDPCPDLDSLLAGVSRVWLVSGYNKNCPIERPMQWELAKRADLEMCIPVTQRLRLNPYAYWVADITVVLYRVRQADSIPLDSPVATPRPHPQFRGA